MATFEAKTWEDRVSEYPTRRILTNISTGTAETVTVERSEGNITNPGDLFNASNMNDLEGRIGDAIDSLNSTFQDGVNAIVAALADEGIVLSASTPEAIEAAINNLRSGGDATAGQVISNKTGFANKVAITGTMPDRGAWNGNNTGNGNVTIPAGYHNGNGAVSCIGSYDAGRSQGRADYTSDVYTDIGFESYLPNEEIGISYRPNGKGTQPVAFRDTQYFNNRGYHSVTYTFNASYNGKLTDWAVSAVS